ncbi:ADP-ribosylglycohydrolase family protein [Streptomyces spinoverrucosus]|uniref:ADP-ribosylglycohydrolase family protein n=1 Tax=Streptomyces spinoverrucosus TaxID=284043 RepID=UPI0018C3D7CC|nr:ADP-ribosylglycohydrolase family protein [Streptomyces spinoverrucosus]MBG0851385.1 ADP-ribosylglycohydrolase family protein [Streptomyces spinoverrucosus]
MTAPAVPALSPRDRARGALLGLAIGDAAGLPALYHRGARFGEPRQWLWHFSAEADSNQVLRFPLPFTQGRPEPLALSGTDDTEFAVAAALILLDASDDATSDELFAGWRKLVVDHADQVWSGIAERSSIVNAQAGLVPPATGNDNPAYFDDGAVARAVPVGIRHAGHPDRAADVATRLAEITHADDGVWAAAAMAAGIAAALSGADAATAVETGAARIPADSWLARQMARALDLAAAAPTPLDLVADLNDQVANASYSFGTIAPETLASAFALVLATGGDPVTALPLAGMVAKQSDSMPPMVGALTGALAGAAALPVRWREKLDQVRGHCLPHLAGTSLTEVADELVTADERDTALSVPASAGWAGGEPRD